MTNQQSTNGPPRTFVGVVGIYPAADQPEHLAYADYEVALEIALARFSASEASAEDAMYQAQVELVEAANFSTMMRGDLGHLRWLVSPARRAERAKRLRVETRATRLALLQERCSVLLDELAEVQQWNAAVREWAIGEVAQRAEAASLAAIEVERMRRDTNPRRGMVLMTAAEFAAQDPRRTGSPNFDSPSGQNLAGMDLGAKWRRDAEEQHSSWGRPLRWRVSYIDKTNELYACLVRPPRPSTFTSTPAPADMVLLLGKVRDLEPSDTPLTYPRLGLMSKVAELESRHDERNSLALVLDLYESDLAPRSVNSQT